MSGESETDKLIDKKKKIDDEREPLTPRSRLHHPNRQCILVSFCVFLAFLTGIFFAIGLVSSKPLLGALFLASIIPSLFILFFAYHDDSVRSDKYSRGVCSTLPDTHSDKVPMEILIIGLTMGMLSCLPVGIIGGLEAALMQSVARAAGPLSMAGMFFYSFVEAFIATAILEEGAKYLCAQYAAQKDELLPYIGHPYGVVLFGLAVALGFAGLENVTYVLGDDGGGWGLAITRAILAVPLHGTTGALIGVGLARRLYLNESFQTAFYVLRWPVFIHGMYDFIWMAPLRSGDFEGKPPMTKDNTLDLGIFLYLVYLGNILFTFMMVAFAVRESKKLRDQYAEELAKSQASNNGAAV